MANVVDIDSSRVIATPVASKSRASAGISKDAILSSVARDVQPVIYINNCSKAFSVDNALLSIGPKKYPLPVTILAEVVEILRNNGIEAYLTNERFGLLPGSFLMNFKQLSTVRRNTLCSPVDLTKIFPKNLLSFNYEDEASIVREVTQVHETDGDIEYIESQSLSPSEFCYKQDQNTLLLSRIEKEVTVVVVIKMTNFYLNIAKESVFDLNQHTKHLQIDSVPKQYVDDVLHLMNHRNRDTF